MFQKLCQSGIVLLILFMCMTSINVSASSRVVVYNENDLKTALADKTVSVITLGNDIVIFDCIDILRPVVIDGAGYALQYAGINRATSNTLWDGSYVLQVYDTDVTIKDIKLMGASGGLLINGASVKLDGTIDVSLNDFGGIELGQGKETKGVARMVLNDNTTLINTTETSNKPTVWIPKGSTGAVIEKNAMSRSFEPQEKLLLADIASLFVSTSNPETADKLPLYVISFIFGSLLMTFGFKRVFF